MDTRQEGHTGCEGTRGILPVGRLGRIYAVRDIVPWLVVRRWLVFGCPIAGGTYV